MKIAVDGYQGRIGQALIDLGCLPFECDVKNYDSVEKQMNLVKPDLLVHLAAKSDVNWCERKENKEEVLLVNLRGTRNVATSAQKHQCGVVLMSTDHIYDGKRGPYAEDYNFRHKHLIGGYEEPVNYYGLSKLTAEQMQSVFPNMKIVRTSYIFTEERLQRHIGLDSYPTFLYRSFQYLPHFMENFKRYLDKFYEMPAVLNLSGTDTVSWYEFMLAWANLCGHDVNKIIPRTKEFKVDGEAKRPHKAGLKVGLSIKLGFKPYSYADGLMQMVAE